MTKRLDSSTASLAFTSIVPRLLLKRKRSRTSFDRCARKEWAPLRSKAVGCKRGNVYKTLNAAGLRSASGLNKEVRQLYRANLFAAMRQLRYSEKQENSLDLVLFLNGIPIFTAEVKNPLTAASSSLRIRLGPGA